MDGTSHVLARPFLVIATQNQVETDGTFPLPISQMDRFAMHLPILPILAIACRMR